MVSESEVRERAWVERREPPLDPVDEPLWVAEDPATDCLGVGSVEAEAVGNLVSVVAEFEAGEGRGRPLMKAPGRAVARPGTGTAAETQTDADPSVLDRLRGLF